MALLFAVGVVAVAQADDGSGAAGGDGGSGDAGGARTTTVKVVTTPAGTVTTPAAAKPHDGDDQGEDDGGSADDANPEKPEDHPVPAPAAEHVPPASAVTGESVGVTPATGTVRVRGDDGRWNDLAAGAALPNDTVVDTRRGSITLAATVDAAGTQQSATFSGAVFAFHQPNTTQPVTELELKGGDFSVCKRAATRARGARAVAAARRKPVRRLFGSGHGRFRTEGRFAAATVHGTIWITEDYCDRTVIRVKRGVVGVTDLRTGRTVNVRAGSSRTIRRR